MSVEKKLTREGYMTKYALTTGIRRVVVELTPSKTRRQYVYTFGLHRIQLVVGVDFFYTVGEAESRARALAKSKVVSLNKALTKMKALAKEPKWEGQ